MHCWKTFSTAYPGFGLDRDAFFSGKLRPRSPAARSTSRHPRREGGKDYLVVITPLNSMDSLQAFTRRVRFSEGLRIIAWMRSRGHPAFLY